MFERLDSATSSSLGDPALFKMTVFSAVKIARGERLTRSAVRQGTLARKGTRQRRRELRRALIDCCCVRCSTSRYYVITK